jgi:hypothetical protein
MEHKQYVPILHYQPDSYWFILYQSDTYCINLTYVYRYSINMIHSIPNWYWHVQYVIILKHTLYINLIKNVSNWDVL